MKFRLTVIQLITHIISLLPLVLLIYGFLFNHLTANPIREITIRTGWTAILIFLLSFTCSPLRQILDMDSFLLIRKALGLYTAFYAMLHFINFIGQDFQFDWTEIFTVIKQQFFHQIGLAALIILALLSIFSFTYFQKKLPGFWKKSWLLVYSGFGLALLHYFMAVKGDKRIPELYLIIFLSLLLFHLSPLNNLQFNIPFLQKFNNFLKFKIIDNA